MSSRKVAAKSAGSRPTGNGHHTRLPRCRRGDRSRPWSGSPEVRSQALGRNLLVSRRSCARAFGGAVNVDQHTLASVLPERTDTGISYTNTATGGCLHVPTCEEPGGRVKLTAQTALATDQFNGFAELPRYAGGPWNQTKRFAEHNARFGDEWPPRRPVRWLPRPPVWASRRSRGVHPGGEYRQLGRGITWSSAARGRPGLVGCGTAGSHRQAVAGAACRLYLASPRRACVPTSLPAEATLALARGCRGLACNAHELSLLAAGLGLDSASIAESSPTAATEALRLVVLLRERRRLACRVVAITLGRPGCVVVAGAARRGFAIGIHAQADQALPATPTGAGDFWHAMWIWEREVNGLEEPLAAAAATRTVARRSARTRRRWRFSTARSGCPIRVLAAPAPALSGGPFGLAVPREGRRCASHG